MAKETKKKAPKKPPEPVNEPEKELDTPVLEETTASEVEAVKSQTNLRKYLLITIASLVGLVLIITILLIAKHGSLAQIRVASIAVPANINQATLEKQVTQSVKGYKLTLKYSGGSKKSYSTAETGIQIDPKASAQNAKQQVNGDFWRRLTWWHSIDIPLKSQVDRAKLAEFIDTKATEVKVAPKDAALAINNGVSSITTEEKGSGYIVPTATSTLIKTIDNLNAAPLQLKASVLTPSIVGKDLTTTQAKVNKLLAQKVTFNLAGRSITATPADIAEWLEITPVKYDKTVDISVDSGNIEKYIDKIAKPYIQPPRSRLITKTADGYVVLDSGSNGVDVVNKSQTASQLVKKISEDKAITIDLAVQYATAKTVEVQPHDKWIVVDVTTKRMYAYEQTNLVRTFLISAGAPKTPTVLGQYAIYSKYRTQDMRGLNADGSRYFQPNVPYINYFYKDYAIHGNYWRPASYFGNINASHGCVGAQTSDAAWVYSWAPIGTTVIVHS